MEEIWRDVLGYEGFYKVSSLGNVKSLDRTVVGSDNISYKLRGKNKKLFLINGYWHVRISKLGKHNIFSVHRLIATAFIPNPENKPMVNHINGVKLDNYLENLEWATSLENMRHAHSNGLMHPKSGANHHKSKMVKNVITGQVYESITAAAKSIGISDCCLCLWLNNGRAKDKYKMTYATKEDTSNINTKTHKR